MPGKTSMRSGNLENDRENAAKTHLLPRQHFVLSSTKQKTDNENVNATPPRMQTSQKAAGLYLFHHGPLVMKYEA